MKDTQDQNHSEIYARSNEESKFAYGANKRKITEVESDSMKHEGYVIEQLGDKPSGLKK